jgi:hypothetical protein
MKPRSHLPAVERRIRSRLTSLVPTQGLLRGNLVTLKNTCGKPNCRCQRGEKHESLYLAQSRQGKPYMRYIPQGWHVQVRAWVQRYQEVQQLLESLSERYWQRVEKREE